jgi:MFS family permease
MDLVALGWLALQFTGSPFMVGVAAFARAATLMVVGPFTGIVADRVPRGRILLVAPAVGMATALALTAIFWSGRGGYGALVALEIVFGLVWALDFPARRTALYTLLGAGRVGQAVSLETVSMQIAKMLGPLAAGLCLAQAGPAAGFAVMALVYGGGLAAYEPASRSARRPGHRHVAFRRDQQADRPGARLADSDRAHGAAGDGGDELAWSRSRPRAGCPCP